MGEHEPLGLRGESDLRRFLGGRVTGVAGALALLFAERCLVNQQVCALRRVYRGRAGTRIACECDEPAWPRSADEAISRQLSAVSKLDCLALGEFAPERAFWNSSGLGFLDVKASTAHLLLEHIAQRRTTTMFSGKRTYVVPIPLPSSPFPTDRIARLHLDDFDRERHALDAQLHGRGQDLLRTLGTVEKQRL